MAVRILDPRNNVDALLSADSIDYRRRQLGEPARLTVTTCAGEEREFRSGKVYVMNASGNTVASYNLED